MNESSTGFVLLLLRLEILWKECLSELQRPSCKATRHEISKKSQTQNIHEGIPKKRVNYAWIEEMFLEEENELCKFED